MTIRESRAAVKDVDNDRRKDDSFIITGVDQQNVRASSGGRKSTAFQACYSLVKANLGAGIFSFPVAYLKSGFFASMILLILTTLFIYWTSSILICMSGSSPHNSTYESIVEHHLGKWGRRICSLSGIVLTFGALCVYAVVIGDSVPPVLLNFSPWTERCILNNTCDYDSTAVFFMDRKVVSVIISLVVILPLSSIRNSTYLSYVSVVGLISLCAIVIILAVKSNLPSTPKGTLTGSGLLSGIDFSGIAFVISTTSYANIVNQNQFPIFDDLADKSKENKLRIVRYCLSFCVAVMLFYSMATYIPLNNRIDGNVLNLFDAGDGAANAARLLFALEIILTAPVVVYICRSFVLNAIYGEARNAPRLSLYAITLLIVAASVTIASSFCKFDIAVALTGGLSASVLAFGLPQMCWVSEKLKNGYDWSNPKIILVSASTLFAALLIVLSVVDLVGNIRNYDSSECAFSFV